METPKCKDTVGDLSSEKISFRCIYCKMSYETPSELCKHSLESHKTQTFYCPNCGKTFVSKALLNNHIGNCFVFRQLSDTHYSCSECGQMFLSLKELYLHEKKHKKDDVVCDVCCQTIKRHNLDRHNKRHIGRRYIECDFCETICFDEDALENHLATHEKEKQVITSNTTKEGEKQDESHWKDKQDEVALEKHLATHEKEKQVITSKTTKEGEKQDAKRKLIGCPYCEEKFTAQYEVDEHLMVHHKWVYVKCPKTGIMLFKSSESLQADEPLKQAMEHLKNQQPIKQEDELLKQPLEHFKQTTYTTGSE